MIEFFQEFWALLVQGWLVAWPVVIGVVLLDLALVAWLVHAFVQEKGWRW